MKTKIYLLLLLFIVTSLQAFAQFGVSSFAVLRPCADSTNGEVTVILNVTASNPPPYNYSLIPISGGCFRNTFSATTTATITGVCPGLYVLVITDGMGNNPPTAPFVSVTALTQLAISSSVLDVACKGDSTGTIQVQGSGGNGSPYIFSLNGGAYEGSGGISHTFTNLAAGTYSISVQDNRAAFSVLGVGCSIPVPINVTINEPPTAVVIDNKTKVDNSSCIPDGSITINASGGTPPYQYVLNAGTPQASPTFAGLANGVYNISVIDDNGCTISDTANIGGYINMTLAATKTDVLCNGDSTGTATITVTNGLAPFQYSSDGVNFNTSNVVTGLAAGVRTITVRDAANCEETIQVTIDEPLPITVTPSAINQVTCFDGNNGAARVVANGGTLPYTYLWTPSAQTNDTAINLTAGTYTITVTDSNNCSQTGNVTITQPDSATININKTDVLGCFGETTGQIIATATGGNGGFQYALNTFPPFGTGTFNNLAAGNYKVFARDNQGCLDSVLVEITQPDSLFITLNTSTNVSCNGLTDGSISVSATGGTPAYSYTIIGGSTNTTGIFTNLAANTYQVVVLDANNCSDTISVTITQPAPLDITVKSQTNILGCFGDATGAIAVGVSGGTPAFSFELIGNVNATGTDSSFANLVAGAYQIKVQDAQGCIDSVTTTLTQPDSISLTVTNITNVIGCNGDETGSITLSAMGGTPTYNYALTGTVNRAAQASNIFATLPAGTYNIVVTDANNCTQDVANVEIIEPDAVVLTVNATTDVLCFGETTGTIDYTATGGTNTFNFFLNGINIGTTNPNVLNVAANPDYTLIAVDGNGCADTVANITISEPTEMVSAITNIVDVACFGDSNASFCVSTNGGVAPHQYALNGAAFQNNNCFTNLTAGTYTVVIRDANNCFDTIQHIVTQPTEIVLAQQSLTNVVGCFGDATGEVCVTVSGGVPTFQFSVNGAAFQNDSCFNNLTAGTYNFVVRDANLCTDTLSNIEITQPEQINATLQSSSNVLCSGDTTGQICIATTGGSPAYQYSIDNAATFQATNCFNVAAGTFNIIAQDANGCRDTVSNILITEPPVLVLDSLSGNNVSCFGLSDGSITVLGNGGVPPYQYSFNGGSFVNEVNFSNLSAGTYNIAVRDANNCLSDIDVTISQPAAIGLAANVVDVTGCFGESNGSITATVSGGTASFTYSLTSPLVTNVTGVFNNLVAGTYILRVIDGNGCRDSVLNVVVDEPEQVIVSGVGVDVVGCSGDNTGSITASAVGGNGVYEFALIGTENRPFQASNLFANLVAGTYRVIGRDGLGCLDTTAVITIDEPLAITATVQNTNNVSCFGLTDGSITITATNGTSPYTFVVGTFSNTTGIFNNLPAGTYSITVTDAAGCSTSLADVILTQPDDIDLNLVADSVNCNAANDGSITATVSGGTPIFQYSLNGSAFAANNVFSNLIAGTYQVVVQDANTCRDTATIQVAQPNPIVASFTVNDNTICEGQSITVNYTGTSDYAITNYNWNFGGGIAVPGTGFGPHSVTFNNSGNPTLSVQVTDSKGCTSAVATQNITVTPIPVADFTFAATYCKNVPNPSPVFINGGVAGTFTALPAGLFIDATNGQIDLASSNVGTYTITNIVTVNGCSDTATTTVTILNTPTAIQFEYNGSPYCRIGEPFNTVNINITGGTPTAGATFSATPAGLALNTNNGSVNLFSSTPGTYTVRYIAANANGCADTSFATITISDGPAAPTVSGNRFYCEGNSTTLTASSTGAVSFNWYRGANFLTATLIATNTNPITINQAGTYWIEAVNAAGCSSVDTFTIQQIDQPNTPTIFGFCAGTTTPSTLGTGAGFAGLTHTWLFNGNPLVGQTTNTITATQCGTYEVFVTDAFGCASDTSASGNPCIPDVAISIIDGENPFCANGSVEIQSSSPFGNRWYQNTIAGAPIATTRNLVITNPGTYIVQVNNGACHGSDTIVVTTKPVPATPTVSGDNTICSQDTGALTSSPTTGTYAWTRNTSGIAGSNTQVLNITQGGSYTVTHTVNGCSATSAVFNVTEFTTPNQPVIVPQSATTFCEGGSVVLRANPAGLNYQWYRNNAIITGATNRDLTVTTSGSYYVEVTTTDGCSNQSDPITITVQPIVVPTVSITSVPDDTLCSPANVNLTATITNGGTTPLYQWTVNGNPAGNLATLALNNLTTNTNVSLQLTSNATCAVPNPVTVSTTIAVFDGFNFGATVSQPTNCTSNNGSITINPNSGSGSYTKVSGNLNIGANTNLAPGTYTLQLRDTVSQCIKDTTITLNAVPLFTFAGTTVANPTCNQNNGSITIALSPASPNYVKVSGNLEIGANNNLGGGTYNIVVRNTITGCQIDTTIVLPDGVDFTVSTNLTNPTDCDASNGAINISVTSGSGNFGIVTNASQGSVNLILGNNTNLSAGLYTFTITDSVTTCSTQTTVELNPPTVNFNLNNTVLVNPTTCAANDGSITLNATGGSGQFAASPLNLGLNANLGAGQYPVLVQDTITGCFLRDTFLLNPPAVDFVVTIDSTQPATCASTDGSITVGATGGSGSFIASPLNIGFNGNLSAGIYNITITDANTNCFTNRQVRLNAQTVDLLAQATLVNPTSCTTTDGSISLNILNGSGNYTFSNTLTSPITTNLGSGTYTVTILDTVSGCFIDTAFVLNPDSLDFVVNANITQPTNCTTCNGSIEIVATGTASAVFVATAGNLNLGLNNNLCPNNYSITVTDTTTGCFDVKTYNLQPAVADFTVVETLNNPTNCNANNGSIAIAITGGSGNFIAVTPPSSINIGNNVGLGAGTQTILVRDIATNCEVQETYNLQPPDVNFTVTPTLIQPTACSACDGQIDLTVTGGSGQFAISGDLTNLSNSGLCSDTYNITITDTTTNCIVPQTYTLNSTVIDFTVSSTISSQTNCLTPDGSISLVVSGGSGNFVFENGLTSAITNNLLAGTYAVRVRDAITNCFIDENYVILDSTASPVVVANLTNPTNCAADDGSIEILANNFTVTSGSLAIGLNSGLTAGSYTITVRDNVSGCDSVYTFDLLPPTLDFTVSAVLSNPTSCNATDGAINISVVGGSGNFAVSGDLSSLNNSGLNADTFSVRITDVVSGCFLDTFFVLQPSNAVDFVINESLVNPTTCAASNGSINVSVTGGSGIFEVVSGNLVLGSNIGLTSGSYNITVRDTVSGCEISESYVLNSDSVDFVIATLVTQPTNCTVDNGIIQINVTGGSGQFVSLNALNIGANNNLTAGQYIIAIKDTVTGCVDSDTVNLLVPDTAFIATVSVIEQPSSCAAIDGVVLVEVVGNSTYTATGNLQIGNNNALSAGTYSITITDNVSGCNKTLSAFLTSDSVDFVINIDSIQSPTNCTANNGYVEISVSGGSGIFRKIGGSAAINLGTNSGLNAGNYSIIVQDTVSGCFDTLSFNLNNPPLLFTPTITTSPVSACGATDGQINVSISGGSGDFEVRINGVLAGFSNNVAAGSYTVNILDVTSGCDTNITVNITAPTLTLSMNDFTLAQCGACDGTLSVLVGNSVGSETFTWTGSSSTTSIANNLCSGNYTVTVVSGTCTSSVTAAVIEPTPFGIAVNTTNETICGGGDGSASLIITGTTLNPAITWKALPSGMVVGTVNTTINNLQPGNYRVVVRDGLCSDSLDFTINPANLVVTINTTNATVSKCGATDASLSANVTGAIPSLVNYTWNTGQTTATINDLGVGTYTVIATSGACADTATASVVNPAPFVFNVTTTDETVCGLKDGTATLTVIGKAIIDSVTCVMYDTGGNVISLMPVAVISIAGDTTTILTDTGLAPSNYYFVVYSGTCSDTVNFTINPATLVTNIINDTTSACGANDGQLTIQVSNAIDSLVQIAWSNGAFGDTVTGLIAGQYIATITAGQCVATDTGTVFDPVPFTLNIDTITPVTICGGNNGTATVSIIGTVANPQIQWRNLQTGNIINAFTNQTTLTGRTHGAYRVIVTDGTCSDSLSFNITTTPTLILTMSNDTTSACGAADGALSLLIGGSVGSRSFVWKNITNPANPITLPNTTANISGLSTGIYRVVVRNGGCIDSIQRTVFDPTPFTLSITTTSVTACNSTDGTATVAIAGIAPNPIITWKNLAGDTIGNTATISNLAVGNYRVVVQDGTCKDSTMANVGTPSLALFMANDTVSFCGYCDGTLNVLVGNSAGNETFTWIGRSDTTSFLNDLCEGTYTVIVTSGVCVDTITAQVLNRNPIITVTNDTVSACGVADGQPTLTANFVSPTVTYQWVALSNGNVVSTAANPPAIFEAGSYVLIWKDSTCTDTIPFDITTPDLVVTLDTAISPSACGANDGTIVVTVAGASASTTYTWYRLPNVTTPFATTLNAGNIFAAGTYRLITQSGTCSDTSEFVLNDGTAPFTLSASVTQACFGNNGSINVTSNLTTGVSLTYTLLPTGTTQTDGLFTNLAPNTYTVSVIDSISGCFNSISNLTIADTCNIPCNLAADISVNNTTCPDDTNGRVVVFNITGGSGSYEFSLAGENIVSSNPLVLFNNKPTGVYTVVITDLNIPNCQVSVTETIESAVQLAAVYSVNNASCIGTDGEITINVVGNNAPYSYQIGNNVPVAFTGSTITISNLIAGTYPIKLISALPCTTDFDTITILQDNTLVTPTVSLSSSAGNVICANTPITFTATDNGTGGNNPIYEWRIDGVVQTETGATLTRNNLVANAIISVKLTSDNPCAAIDTAVTTFNLTVQPPTTALVTITATSTEICAGDTVTFTANNVNSIAGVTYQWFVNGALEAGAVNSTFTTTTLANAAQVSVVMTAPLSASCVTGSPATSDTITINYGANCDTTTPTCNLFKTSFVTAAECEGINNGIIDIDALLLPPLTPNLLTYGIDTAGNGTFITQTGKNADKFLNLAGNRTYRLLVAIPSQNCADTFSVSVGVIKTITPGVIGVTQPTNCTTLANGSIKFNAPQGGIAPYNYSVAGSTFSTQTLYPNLASGNYPIAIRDAQGCRYTSEISIDSAEQAPQVFASVVSSPLCANGTGSIRVDSVKLAGQLITNNLEFNLDNSTVFNALTVGNIIPNVSGTQTVYVRIAGANCVGETTINIPTPAPIAVSVTQQQAASCGSNDGIAFVNQLSGGTSPYTLVLRNLSTNTSNVITLPTSNLIENLEVATYRLVVTDANGCSDSTLFNIQPTNPVVPSVTLTATATSVCAGETVTLTATPTNVANPTYIFSVAGVVQQNSTNNTFTITVNTNTTVNVVVKTTDPCAVPDSAVASQTITIAAPSVAAVTLTVPDSVCPNVPVTLTATNVNNTQNVTYTWFAGTTQLGQTTTPTFSTTFTTTGTQNIFVVMAAPVSATCVTGSPDTSNIRNVFVRPANSPACGVSPTCNLAASVQTTNATCPGVNNGVVVATVSGGSGNYQFRLNNGTWETTPSFNNLATGSQTLQVRDANDTTCNVTVAFTIGVNASLGAVIVPKDPTACANVADGEIRFLTVIGGTAPYEYSINGGLTYVTNNTFTGLVGGIYQATVRDSLGCVFTVQIDLNTGLPIEPVLQVANNVTCFGGNNGVVTVSSVTNGVGPYQYSFNGTNFLALVPNVTQITGLSAGNVPIYVRDLGTNCTVIDTVSLTQPDSISVTVVPQAGSECLQPTGSAKLTLLAGGTSPYTLTRTFGGVTVPVFIAPDSIITNLGIGQHVITVTDANGCIKTTTFTISGDVPRIDSIATIPACQTNNGEIHLRQSAGGEVPYSYSLFLAGNTTPIATTTQQNPNFTALAVGSYVVRITDNKGCFAEYSVTIAPSNVNFTAVKVSDASCVGRDGVAYITNFVGVAPFFYSFDSLAVDSFLPFRSVNGDTIYLTGLEARPNIGFTIRIRDSAPGGGCFVSKPLFIGGERAMTFDTAITEVVCNGQNNGRISFTNVQGTPPFLITISRASSGSQVFRDTIQIAGNFEVTGLSADVYNVTIIQPGQCAIQQAFSFEVKQPAPLAVNWRVTKTTDFGFRDGEITIDSISGGNKPYRAAFDFREFRNLNNDTIFRFLDLRCHNFQVIDNKGCQLETELCVARDTVLLVPNIFTPNVDGANDKFIIRAIPNGTVFEVYTRWGKLVYRSTNYQNDWDGKDMNGNDIMDGVYFYEIDIPNVRKQNGWIQIQRW